MSAFKSQMAEQYLMRARTLLDQSESVDLQTLKILEALWQNAFFMMSNAVEAERYAAMQGGGGAQVVTAEEFAEIVKKQAQAGKGPKQDGGKSAVEDIAGHGGKYL
jgi:hypothetical protein